MVVLLHQQCYLTYQFLERLILVLEPTTGCFIPRSNLFKIKFRIYGLNLHKNPKFDLRILSKNLKLKGLRDPTLWIFFYFRTCISISESQTIINGEYKTVIHCTLSASNNLYEISQIRKVTTFFSNFFLCLPWHNNN